MNTSQRKGTDQGQAKRALCEKAYGLFREFRGAYVSEWQRLENCERMYRGDHWHDVPMLDRNEPRPVTPIIQSTVENIKAELLDRVPDAVILPESPKDGEIAHVIEAIIRQNHDADGYVKEYRKLVHDLLVGGYCVQEVGYDNTLNAGLGGAFIRHVDARSILFDPLATDAQESRAVFKISLKTREYIESRFPKAAPFLTADAFGTPDAVEDGNSAGFNDAVLIYDLARGTYMVRRGFTTSGQFAAGGTLYLMDGNGYVCRFEEGETYDGARIDAYWKTPMTDLDSKAVCKRLEELYLRGSGGILSLEAVTESGTVYNERLMPGGSERILELGLNGEGRAFQLVFRNVNGSHFTIDGGVELIMDMQRRVL